MRVLADRHERLVLEAVLRQLGADSGVDVDAAAVGAHGRTGRAAGRRRGRDVSSVARAHRARERRVEVDVLALVAGRVDVREVVRRSAVWRSEEPRGRPRGELGGVEQVHGRRRGGDRASLALVGDPRPWASLRMSAGPAVGLRALAAGSASGPRRRGSPARRCARGRCAQLAAVRAIAPRMASAARACTRAACSSCARRPGRSCASAGTPGPRGRPRGGRRGRRARPRGRR